MCVLLVEDEPMIRGIMSECLKDAGYEVMEAENGDLAIEIIQQSHQFCILVTDFHMPGSFDGSHVAARVRDAIPDIPVVIASGRPDAFQTFWQTDLGYQFLKKPYLPSDLIKVVASLTRRTESYLMAE